MGWQFVLVLILMIPLVLLPVVFVWYLSLGGIWTGIKTKRLTLKIPGRFGSSGSQ